MRPLKIAWGGPDRGPAGPAGRSAATGGRRGRAGQLLPAWNANSIPAVLSFKNNRNKWRPFRESRARRPPGPATRRRGGCAVLTAIRPRLRFAASVRSARVTSTGAPLLNEGRRNASAPAFTEPLCYFCRQHVESGILFQYGEMIFFLCRQRLSFNSMVARSCRAPRAARCCGEGLQFKQIRFNSVWFLPLLLSDFSSPATLHVVLLFYSAFT